MLVRPLIALALVLGPPLRAQGDSVRAVVEGRVVDPAGGPIRGETVVLVRRPGCRAQALRVDLRSGIWRGSIVLVPGSQRLPDIEVAARYAKPAQYSGTTKYDDFFRRQKLSLGTFISREQIERMNAFHTIEILRGIPGDPATADIRIPRCESPDHRLGKVTVWIDGQMLIESQGGGPYGSGSLHLAEMLERIAPTGSEMVEVFRGVSQIPGEFHWDGCAAIAIWTRYNRRADSPPMPPTKPR